MNQLRGLEEELDAQVARVEAQARDDARNKFEQEKRNLVEKMESESMELQTRLRLFQKVRSSLSLIVNMKNGGYATNIRGLCNKLKF